MNPYAITLPAFALVALAPAHVAPRTLHSAIHCTYNRVNHRFAAFLLSAIVLAALWGALVLGLR